MRVEFLVVVQWRISVGVQVVLPVSWLSRDIHLSFVPLLVVVHYPCVQGCVLEAALLYFVLASLLNVFC